MRGRSLHAIGLWRAVLVLAAAMLIGTVGLTSSGEAASPRQILEFIDGGQNIRVGLAINVEQVTVDMLGRYAVLTADSKQIGILDRGDKIVAAAKRSLEARPGAVTFRVQVQASREEARLKELAGRLEVTCPYPVHIVYVKPWYKLQVGDFPSRTEAERAQTVLSNLGFTDTWITTFAASPTGESYVWLDGVQLSEPLPRASKITLEPLDANARFQLNGHRYRGRLVIALDQQLRLTAINVLPMEEYLYGVVSAEMGNAGLNEIEALKAQAVAARTYAINHLGSYEAQGFDVLGTVQSQAYYGTDRETAPARYAVDATKGQVMVYGGEIPSTVYHSNAGGHTAFAEEVWGVYSPILRGQSETIFSRSGGRERVLGVDKLGYSWEVTLQKKDLDELAARLDFAGAAIRDIVVEARGKSGRVTQLRVETSVGDAVLFRDKIRQILGGARMLQSTKFHLEKRFHNDSLMSVTIRGFGYGHGLGMSQAGAIDLAAEGWKYQEILGRYYADVRTLSLEAYRDFVAQEAVLEELGLRKTGWQAVQLPVDPGKIDQVMFSPDGTRLAIVGRGFPVLVWSEESPDEWQSFGELDVQAVELAWLSPTELVYTRRSGGDMSLLYVDVAARVSDVWGQGAVIRSLQFDPERGILYAEIDGIIQAYICRSGVWLPLLANATCPAVSHSGQAMAFVRDKKVWVYDTRTGESWALGSIPEPVSELAWSSDDRWLVVEAGESLRVFNAGERTQVFTASGVSPRWSSGGYLIYVRQENTQKDVWVVKVGEWREVNLTHTDNVSELLAAWDPVSMRLAIAADGIHIVDNKELTLTEKRSPVSVIWLVRIR